MRFNHAKKNTIESELIRLTSLILLSSIILCTIISNLILYKQNYENVKRYNNDMLEQISQSTSSYFSTINLVVYNFVCNQQAQYYLIQARKDNSPTTSTISYLENNLRQISYALPGCNLHLFIDNPSCPPIYMEDPSLIFTPGYHFKEDSWYQEFSKIPENQMYLVTTYEDRHYYINQTEGGITIIYRIRNNSNLNTIGYLLADIPGQVLREKLNIRNQPRFYLKIVNSEQKEILNTLPPNENGKLFQMTVYEPFTSWIMTAYTQNDNFNTNSTMVMFSNIFCAFLVGTAAFLLSVHFARSLTEPLKVLTASMQEMETGTFGNLIYCKTDNEIGFLIDQYNAMNQKIRDLTQKKESAELAQKDAQITMLQNQINPHFLYNTLEMIQGIADGPSSLIIKNCCNALSRMFRYNLKGPHIVTLEQELQHIKYYIYIMELRFNHLFQAKYQIDETLLRYKTVKFSLQPFIENAILHGFTEHQLHGVLLISVSREVDGRIQILIKDNGYGISSGTLGKIRQQIHSTDTQNYVKKEYGSVGIVNTHQRLLQHFGDEYSFYMDSVPQKGTTVAIHLPRIL